MFVFSSSVSLGSPNKVEGGENQTEFGYGFGDSFGNQVGSVSTFLRYHKCAGDFQQGFS